MLPLDQKSWDCSFSKSRSSESDNHDLRKIDEQVVKTLTEYEERIIAILANNLISNLMEYVRFNIWPLLYPSMVSIIRVNVSKNWTLESHKFMDKSTEERLSEYIANGFINEEDYTKICWCLAVIYCCDHMIEHKIDPWNIYKKQSPFLKKNSFFWAPVEPELIPKNLSSGIEISPTYGINNLRQIFLERLQSMIELQMRDKKIQENFKKFEDFRKIFLSFKNIQDLIESMWHTDIANMQECIDVMGNSTDAKRVLKSFKVWLKREVQGALNCSTLDSCEDLGSVDSPLHDQESDFYIVLAYAICHKYATSIPNTQGLPESNRAKIAIWNDLKVLKELYDSFKNREIENSALINFTVETIEALSTELQ